MQRDARGGPRGVLRNVEAAFNSSPRLQATTSSPKISAHGPSAVSTPAGKSPGSRTEGGTPRRVRLALPENGSRSTPTKTPSRRQVPAPAGLAQGAAKGNSGGVHPLYSAAVQGGRGVARVVLDEGGGVGPCGARQLQYPSEVERLTAELREAEEHLTEAEQHREALRRRLAAAVSLEVTPADSDGQGHDRGGAGGEDRGSVGGGAGGQARTTSSSIFSSDGGAPGEEAREKEGEAGGGGEGAPHGRTAPVELSGFENPDQHAGGGGGGGEGPPPPSRESSVKEEEELLSRRKSSSFLLCKHQSRGDNRSNARLPTSLAASLSHSGGRVCESEPGSDLAVG
ncbi:hypothetical protein T484DRAFT_1910298, partial [Baffinella frigidus]